MWPGQIPALQSFRPLLTEGVEKLTEADLLDVFQRVGDNWQVMATPRATNQSETTSTGKPMMLV